MILKSFDFQCDFDFQITISKMNLILKSSTYDLAHLWPSCFILYFKFIFPMNLASSMNFVIMTSLRYYDVTHFLTDPDENLTAYVKLEIKDNFCS